MKEPAKTTLPLIRVITKENETLEFEGFPLTTTVGDLKKSIALKTKAEVQKITLSFPGIQLTNDNILLSGYSKELLQLMHTSPVSPQTADHKESEKGKPNTFPEGKYAGKHQLHHILFKNTSETESLVHTLQNNTSLRDCKRIKAVTGKANST